ncbi:hypothetical protein G7Z17_g13642 [Cylindrodendrum hubeiense]|uniref:Uncharacterized protein n=1 Tax=Cylindrodendrum hubeiense TaxID=595255 RepID=A0A9P5L821_9HYPO|nr:hypothetical protein G7Z17_g13642 [Cylindrodendrum hubeiense]
MAQRQWLMHPVAWASEKGTVWLWHSYNSVYIQVLEGHEGWMWSADFSADSNLAALASGKTVRLWRVDSGECIQKLEHKNSVTSFAVSPNTNLVASAAFDEPVRIWQVDSGECIQVLHHKDSVTSVAFSLDSKLVASVSKGGTTRHWQIDSGECIQVLDYKNPVISVAFSPDAKLVASAASDGTVRLWKVDSGVCVQESLDSSDGNTTRPLAKYFDEGLAEGKAQWHGDAAQSLEVLIKKQEAMEHDLGKLQREVQGLMTASSGEQSHNPKPDASEPVQGIFKGMDLATPSRDIEECYSSFDEKLSTPEKNKAWGILLSAKVQKLLNERKTSTLVIESAEFLGNVYNPLNFAATFLAKELAANRTHPIVLSFHSGCRTFESLDHDVSGPLGMINSLNAQLLTQVLERNRDTEIPMLDDIEKHKTYQKKLSAGIQLFRETLGTLSDEDNVVIILDSLSAMTGNPRRQADILSQLLEVIYDADVVVRMVVSDINPSLRGVFFKKSCTRLWVREVIRSRRRDIGLECLRSATQFDMVDLGGKGPLHSELGPREESSEFLEGFFMGF